VRFVEKNTIFTAELILNTLMKTIALNDKHQSLGAKMVPFAGFNMPVSYAGVNIEHQVVRESVGVFDVSHMGEFFISGPKSEALLQRVCSNDISKITIGQAQYNCMPNETGGIVDDLIVYKMDEDSYMAVVNASNIDKDFAHISKYNSEFGATLVNNSDDYALLAVQGPKATEVLQQLTEVDLSAIKFYHFEVGTLAGINDIIISATGYTGSGGFELYCKNQDAETLWDAVFKAGESFGIQPIGLAARDTLRLEMGYCLYGNDIDDTTSPLAAGLGWITKFTKDFVNSESLAIEKEQGSSQKLVGFVLEERGIPRTGYEIVDQDGTVIGKVTSGTMSPSLSKGIGMGYVTTSHSKIDTPIWIQIRKNQVAATITKLPFYKQ
jgi:aminomethyltransferase